MVSTNVFAEWTDVAGNDAAGLTKYVDLEKINRQSNKVKMWQLSDFKTVQIFAEDNTRYLSSVSRYEYDCEEETARQLDLYWYSGNMRGGEVVYSHSNIQNQAESIVPGSVGETLYKIACGKK